MSRAPKTKQPPARRATRARDLISGVVGHSYWLSRGWAWCSRIEIEPRVRIPVPRLFTRRDP